MQKIIDRDTKVLSVDILADIMDPGRVPGSPRYCTPDIASYPETMDDDIWTDLIRRDDPDEYIDLLHDEELETYWDSHEISAIYTMGTLGMAVARWYRLDILTDQNIGRTKIRAGLVGQDGWLYYVTGIGYDTVDRDLLGGDGSGEAKKRFLNSVKVVMTL